MIGALIPIPPLLRLVVSTLCEILTVSMGADVCAVSADAVDDVLRRSVCVRRVRCAARRAFASLMLSCCVVNVISEAAMAVAGFAAKTRCAVAKPKRICDNSSEMATKRVYLTLKLPKMSIIFCTFADKSAKPLEYDGCPTLGAKF